MTASDSSISSLFLKFSSHKLLKQYWPRLRSCVEPLTDEQVWWRANDASNSIGNLILHLNGNVTQWLVASFNRHEDLRNRPVEFSTKEGSSAPELVNKLGATMDASAEVLGRLTEAELIAHYDIQGYHVTGLDAVYQVVEHFGLHYGQILYITKTLQGADLGFYAKLNATGRTQRESGQKP